MSKNEMIAKIRKIGLFDFLASYAYILSRDELILFFREFNYAVHELNKDTEKKATEKLIEYIEEREY